MKLPPDPLMPSATMTSPYEGEPLTGTPDRPADPLPLAVRQSPLWRWATPALSVVVLLVVGYRLILSPDVNLPRLRSLIPTDPRFWCVFALYYVTPILADFAIFRRLWHIPLEGLVALARKQVGNELLVDYVGEVYFYGWARKKLDMATSPFGAVKDVAILSALVGNGATLAMMIIAYPFAGRFALGPASGAIAASLALVIVISLLVLIFGKRVFSLTRSQLWWVAAIQSLRIGATTGLIALAWSLALPKVALGWWIVLATIRLMLARLPLLTNKDVLFAGVAVFLLGHNRDIDLLMTLMATIVLLSHLAVGGLLAVGDLVTVDRGRTKG